MPYKNPEDRKARQKIYKEENKEKIKQRQKAYYEANKEKRKAYAREYGKARYAALKEALGDTKLTVKLPESSSTPQCPESTSSDLS
jgi:hypothetical protein